VRAFYDAALPRVREALPALPLLLSFIPPNDHGAAQYVAAARATAGAGELIADQHWYLNWKQPVGVSDGWAELHRAACHDPPGPWAPYAEAAVPVVVGEWSLATNHDAPLDLGHAPTVAHLRRLYDEQLAVYTRDPHVVGAFYWTLRMGSGWDPRPTAGAPDGRHVDGATPWRSLDGYPFKVWSLLEMAAASIAGPLDGSHLDGACVGI
jgi:hypothetical protein